MQELFSKAILSGLGFANLTKEAIQQTVQDLVNQSKLSEAEGHRVVKDFQHRAARAQQKLERHVQRAVASAFDDLDISKLGNQSKVKKTPKRRSKKSRPRISRARSAR